MAQMYYDDDADLSIIQGRNVAVIGYGSQGHAHALSLRDSGVDVRVGLREGSKSWAKAEAEGLRVVSPAQACEEADLPLLGGVATVGEAMGMLERGYNVCKFFPAEANGGAKALKAFAGPLPQMNFCPTGGVTPENAKDYLSLPNVLCVGGSWIASSDLVNAGKWSEIEERARVASGLKG